MKLKKDGFGKKNTLEKVNFRSFYRSNFHSKGPVRRTSIFTQLPTNRRCHAHAPVGIANSTQ